MVEIEHICFSYGEGTEASMGLHDVSLRVNKGEFVVLCGKSGCGKTTLTRLINGLIPHYYEGQLTGSVRIGGIDIHKQPLANTARLVGSVFQNPRSQFFNVNTASELAFGCENLALSREEILQRVQNAAAAFSLNGLLNRSIFELSGGEKQRIACASVYAVGPEVFVLDEPSSNLDAASIRQLREALSVLKASGKTIIVSEHRLHYLTGLADRFVCLKSGAIVWERSMEDMLLLTPEALFKTGLRSLRLDGLCRNDVQTGEISSGELTLQGMQCRYDKQLVLDIPTLSLSVGEILAVIGHNGAGKSTLAGCLCGITKCKGRVLLGGKTMRPKERLQKSYMVMQDVNHQLFTESVAEELTLGIPEERKRLAAETLESLGLSRYSETHPLALSGGEKQRVAIGSAVCAGKKILIYDEPTSGQDLLNMLSTCKLLRKAAENAILSLVITHDLEFIIGCCTSVLHMCGGKVLDYYPLDDLGMKKLKQYFLDDNRERMNAI